MSENFRSIEHEGIVKSSDKKSVTVSIISSSACTGCHAEGICSLSGREEKTVEIPGIYKVVPGESVTVLMKQSSGFAAVFLGYVLPLILVVVVLIFALILYFVAQKFRIYEDPRIDEVQAALPAANCGGCGFAGCRNFAEAIVKAETFEGLNCPVGGAPVMGEAAKILGKVV